MKTNVWQRTAAVLAVAACSLAGSLPAATLKVGDDAPKLQTGKWVQGEPVKQFEKGKVYFVEFWATWCGPCQATIPHVNELHAKLEKKGLVVIGQDVWERDESKVEPFVKQMGEKMTYRVAMDDKSNDEQGAMATTWMKAAGRNGIPSAFVVDGQGKIAWIGHPAQLKEKTLEQILDGTFDSKKAASEAEAMEQKQATLMKHWQAIGKAVRSKNWDDADTALKEADKVLEEDERAMLATPRLQVAFGKKDYKAASQIAEQLSDKNKDNAMMQNQLAWTIVSQEGIDDPGLLKTAEKIAGRANDAAKGKDAAILDTLARAQFVNGNKDQAVATQQKAMDLADDDNKADYRKTLESYKAGKLPKPE